MSYIQNKAIPTYSEIRKKRERDYNEELKQEESEVFLIMYKYYIDNYPKTEKELEWIEEKVDLKFIEGMCFRDELKRFTEDELYSIFNITDYFRKEKRFKKSAKYEILRRILAYTKNIIPGGKYVGKLRELREKMNEDNMELKRLEKIIEDARIEFRAKKQEFEKNKVINIEDNKKDELDLYKCSTCGKVCKTKGGLTSHIRVHNT